MRYDPQDPRSAMAQRLCPNPPIRPIKHYLHESRDPDVFDLLGIAFLRPR